MTDDSPRRGFWSPALRVQRGNLFGGVLVTVLAALGALDAYVMDRAWGLADQGVEGVGLWVCAIAGPIFAVQGLRGLRRRAG